MNQAWLPIEHEFRRILKQQNLLESKFLLAHSGGLDSSCMLSMLSRCLNPAQFRVFHFHHGLSSIPEVLSYRNKALAEVQSQVSGIQKTCVVEKWESSKELQSEEQFREARFEALRRHQTADEILLTAHHLDDELETDLIKLIRGVGPDGFVSFQILSERMARPFLSFSKQQLRDYAAEMQLSWTEDPSNQDVDYLRNWIRQQWLPELEATRAGSVQTLGRSIKNLKSFLADKLMESNDTALIFDRKNGIEVSYFLTLSTEDRKLLLARYLRALEVRNFTQNHLIEILKHLDNPRNEHTFKVASCQWSVNAEQIVAEKLALAHL